MQCEHLYKDGRQCTNTRTTKQMVWVYGKRWGGSPGLATLTALWLCKQHSSKSKGRYYA